MADHYAYRIMILIDPRNLVIDIYSLHGDDPNLIPFIVNQLPHDPNDYYIESKRYFTQQDYHAIEGNTKFENPVYSVRNHFDYLDQRHPYDTLDRMYRVINVSKGDLTDLERRSLLKEIEGLGVTFIPKYNTSPSTLNHKAERLLYRYHQYLQSSKDTRLKSYKMIQSGVAPYLEDIRKYQESV